MKRIRIEKVRCFDVWAFRITKQTHRGTEFGKGGQKHFQGSKLRLISYKSPKLSPYCDAYKKDVFVQGEDKLKDKEILIATEKEMQDIEQVIAEYNKFFSDSNSFSFKIGDPVWDVLRGEGKVITLHENAVYSVSVKIINNIHDYTYDGKYLISDILPSLYKYPVEIVKL